MKNLQALRTPPTYYERYSSIVASKYNPRRGLLEALNSLVQVRFTEYESAVANRALHLLAEDTVLQRHGDDLRHCYESETQSLSEVRHGIQDAQPAGALKWCPYCGITKPGSFDHYLPKEKFPEFSTHPHNLVHSCTGCNSIKGVRWILTGERLFIHFYSDELTEVNFLSVRLEHRDGAFSATFRINRPAAFDLSAWVVIENHFRELNLVEKYKENANNEIVQAANICAAHLRNGGVDITAFLSDLVGEEESVFGRNHWRNVLIRSLASDSDFADVVRSKVVSAP